MILFDEVESLMEKLQVRLVQASRLVDLTQRRFGADVSVAIDSLLCIQHWLRRCEECSSQKEDARRSWLKKSEETLDQVDRLCIEGAIFALKKVCQEQGSRILTPLGQRYLRMILSEIDSNFENGETEEALGRALRLNTVLRLEDEDLRWQKMAILLPREPNLLRPRTTGWRSSQSHAQAGER